MNNISDYDYNLPERLIARSPRPDRTSARLMVVDRKTKSIRHQEIADLPQLLLPGDCLVFNNTRVIPAKLHGYRTSTGGKWEGLFLNRDDEGRWRVIGQTRGKLQPGETISLTVPHMGPIADKEPVVDDPQKNEEETLELELIEPVAEEGSWLMSPRSEEHFLKLLEKYGTVPLPPYIKRKFNDPRDIEQYQTTYAEHPGSVAAPTAGLHFTPELIDQCRERGIHTAFVTLHVGLGTFRPVKVEKLDDHDMHSEWCEVSPETVQRLKRIREEGGRIVSVGTTTVRTLESASAEGELQAWSGETNLFIRPGYEFKSIDVLMTNFHLPKSTLLVLVSAFADRELISKAYDYAIRDHYRFFSYGDAMLIL